MQFLVISPDFMILHTHITYYLASLNQIVFQYAAITVPAEFSSEEITVTHFFSANLYLNKIEVSFEVRVRHSVSNL